MYRGQLKKIGEASRKLKLISLLCLNKLRARIALSQDSEKMKTMIAFKKRLEEQLEKLTAETKEVQATLDTVNQILA